MLLRPRLSDQERVRYYLFCYLMDFPLSISFAIVACVLFEFAWYHFDCSLVKCPVAEARGDGFCACSVLFGCLLSDPSCSLYPIYSPMIVFSERRIV